MMLREVALKGWWVKGLARGEVGEEEESGERWGKTEVFGLKPKMIESLAKELRLYHVSTGKHWDDFYKMGT